MRGVLQTIRQKFHPLHYARKTAVGRLVLRTADCPAWISIPGVRFRVRGQLLTHGLAYGMIGSQERNPEALALACLQHFRFRTFWDVGANFGYYSWLLKSAAPELEIVLIEPLPANIKLIRGTIQRNQFADVTLIEAGASDCPGDGILHADELGGSTSSLNNEETFEQHHYGTAPKSLRIPLVSIDCMRDRHSRIDFMKIDVEGHEEAVLRGARETISHDQPVLFIECAHEGHRCLTALESCGYRIVDADNLSVDCSGSSANFFCFPVRCHDSMEEVLRLARSRD